MLGDYVMNKKLFVNAIIKYLLGILIVSILLFVPVVAQAVFAGLMGFVAGA